MYDVVIIGAGVMGCSIFRELTRYNLKVAVLDKENDVSMGTSKANSAIIHAGYDPKEGTLMAELNVKGNEMIEDICSELDVPFKRNGSLILAFNDDDMKIIKELYNNGVRNKVKGLKILKKEEVLKMEPLLNENICGALYAPTGGIIGPFEYTIALAENGVLNGGEVKLNKEVTAIEKDKYFKIKTKDKDVLEARFIVNAAGVYSDNVHNMICEKEFEIKPRLGEYMVLTKEEGRKFRHTIFQCPSEKGKGVLITPTVHDNLLVGPDAIDVDSKEDTGTLSWGLESIKRTSMLSSERVNFKEVIKNFAGLRAVCSKGDFIIEENEKIKGFIDVSGMMSPGLSSSPAVALKVVGILEKAGLDLKKKENFNPIRKQTKFMDLTSEEKNELIKKDSRYGNIVCRCEKITEGEIIEAINRSFNILSLDGIKRRCRPGMGKCQGGFCRPKVQSIIAEEYKIDLQDVVLDKNGSYILVSKSK